jgi:SAM-dependent methyltransferase
VWEHNQTIEHEAGAVSVEPSASNDEPARSSYPIDPEQTAELARLRQQDRLVTEAMGGLFPEGQSLPPDGQVLDLACGPGGWAMQVAFAHPSVEVIGVDLSPGVIDYARAQASSRHLTNVAFAVMDIRQPLTFADASFDLINGCFLFSFMAPTAPQAWRHNPPDRDRRPADDQPRYGASFRFRLCRPQARRTELLARRQPHRHYPRAAAAVASGRLQRGALVR